MNKEQKHFLARVVEISAFGQFGAIGYTAYLENNWFSVALSLSLLSMLLISAYAILGLDIRKENPNDTN